MVCSTMIGNGSASTRTATLAISITPPGMAARNAVLASVAVIRINMSAPNPATTMEYGCPHDDERQQQQKMADHGRRERRSDGGAGDELSGRTRLP